MKNIPARWRWTLSTFRFLTLGTLFLLLAGFWFELDRPNHERSSVPIYLDSSESLLLNRSGWAGAEETQRAVETLVDELERRQIPFEIHRFARSIDPLVEDSLWKSATRFDSVIQHLSERLSRPAAALLLSDGLDTHRDVNELALPSTLPPLYTVSFGASQSETDLVLEDVLLPNPVDLHMRSHLWVRVSRSRMMASSATIELRIDGELLDPVLIDFSDRDSVVTQSIPVQFQDTGRVDIDVRLSVDESEWSSQNNHWREFRDVLDRRTVVWHVATTIYPDIRWVREQLHTDRQLHVVPLNLFEESVNLPESAPDLIVLHGNPYGETWPSWLLEHLNRTGIVWLAGPDGVAVPENEENLHPPAQPLTSVNSPQQRSLSSIPVEQREDILLEPFRAVLDEATTPLWIHASSWQLTPATRTVWMNGDPSIPFLFYQEVGNRRRILLTASGWYRFPHSNRSQETELASELFSSIIQWVVPDLQGIESEDEYWQSAGSEWTRRMREHHPSGRNDQLLKYLSNESGGEWRSLDNPEEAERWFNALEQVVEEKRWSRIRVQLVPSPYWFFWVLLLLASEWSLRRRFRMM